MANRRSATDIRRCARWDASEEALRLESPFRYHLRHATRTTEVEGVPVAAGSTLLLLWGAANRAPAEYDRPDEVVLDRPAPKHHLAFGRGVHFCVGAPLARLVAADCPRRRSAIQGSSASQALPILLSTSPTSPLFRKCTNGSLVESCCHSYSVDSAICCAISFP
jgi:cytochrome P450